MLNLVQNNKNDVKGSSLLITKLQLVLIRLKLKNDFSLDERIETAVVMLNNLLF